MYFRLAEAAPSCVVLAQVAFSALLTARHPAMRNRFNRKIADFVLCTRAFQPIAVIELDDSSHAGREKIDKARDELLTRRGIPVLRYPAVPDLADLRRDIADILAPTVLR